MIKPKFQINQSVWVLTDNKVRNCIVYGVTATHWATLKNGTVFCDGFEYTLGEWHPGVTEQWFRYNIKEDSLFPTKKALIKSL